VLIFAPRKNKKYFFTYLNKIMNKKFVVGVDVGGSHITAGLIDMANKSYVPNTEVRKRVNSHAPADEILGIWAATIAEVDPNGEYCIGMAMPGPFDYPNGIALIKGFNKYDELYGLNIRELLAERLNIKGEMIRFRNDAEAFLEGEVFCGAAKGFTNVIGITLGTGLGTAISKGGITIDAEMSVTPYKGEIIEEYVSTRGLVRTYFNLSGKKVENVKIIEEHIETDELASEAFKIFASDLTWFLHQFIQKTNPDFLVVGGNIANGWELFMNQVITDLTKLVDKMPKIGKSTMGEFSALIGGACCFKEFAH